MVVFDGGVHPRAHIAFYHWHFRGYQIPSTRTECDAPRIESRAAICALSDEHDIRTRRSASVPAMQVRVPAETCQALCILNLTGDLTPAPAAPRTPRHTRSPRARPSPAR